MTSGKETFIGAAFPSACGKTNMAMLESSLPNYKVRCIGDDIAWMRFDESGILHAINPESGFFGVCPGTNYKTNPNAMKACEKNCIMTNVAETKDGYYFWEGLEDCIKNKVSVKLHELLHKETFWGFPTRSDTNWAVQPQKMARGLKLRIYELEG